MNDPKQFLTEMMIAATGLNELYESLVESGFSEDQALELVKTVLAETFRGAKGGDQ